MSPTNWYFHLVKLKKNRPIFLQTGAGPSSHVKLAYLRVSCVAAAAGRPRRCFTDRSFAERSRRSRIEASPNEAGVHEALPNEAGVHGSKLRRTKPSSFNSYTPASTSRNEASPSSQHFPASSHPPPWPGLLALARWEGRQRARERPSKPKTAIGSLRRARRFTRAESMFTKLGNIPTEFKELLERCFCVFLKIIRIPSGFEELCP